MNKIKLYNTNLTTMDAELFKRIKNLASKLNKDKKDLSEEAAQDLIKKYESQKNKRGHFRPPIIEIYENTTIK